MSRMSKTWLNEVPAVYGPCTKMATSAATALPISPQRARSWSFGSLLLPGAHNKTNAATPANKANAT